MNPAPTAETLSLLDKLKALFSPSAENKAADKPADPGLGEIIARQAADIAKLQAGSDSTGKKLEALEKDKTDLSAKVASLETEREKLKTDFQAALKETGAREAASILAKLNIAPIALKADATPGASSKSLLQEWNEADAKGRNDLLVKYGASNIAKNLRKPDEA